MKEIKLLIGGSPCQHWSVAQKTNRETTATGEGWELFKNYLLAKEKFQPDFFLYENVKSASQAIKSQISDLLQVGIEPSTRFTYINSALVSAQNRQRFYVTNFRDIAQPKDQNVFLSDILERESDSPEYLSVCCVASRGRYTGVGGSVEQNYEPREDGKTNSLTTVSKDNLVAIEVPLESKASYTVKENFLYIGEKKNPTGLKDGAYIIRDLSVKERARLQTMPDDYCKSVSKTQASKAFGNGWTAEVIIHLLNHALKGTPKDTPLKVLSMYDGIATGRYCLDKMGFTNIEYHAYEIDKFAIKVAKDNYPDIFHHGDAFQVRENNWIL